MEECMYRVSIKGLAYDDRGRILLSREINNKWDILGGGLDHGEEPANCLKREVFEEAGLEIDYIAQHPKYIFAAQNEVTKYYMLNIVFEVKLKSLDFTPSDECQELKYFSVDEMANLDLYPNGKKLLEILET